MTGVAADTGGLTAAEKALQRGEGDEAARAAAEHEGAEGREREGDGARQETEGGGAEQQQGKNGAEKDKDNRQVPYGALKEEREARKSAERRAERMEQMFQKLLTERGKPAAAEAAKPADDLPSIADAPVEHLDARLHRIEETAKQREEREKRENDQRAELQKIRSQIGRKEQIFVEENPDYPEALAFARNLNIRRYYRATGDLQAAQQMAQRDELDFAVANLKRGKNPARCAYNLALDWGYKKAAPAKGSTEAANENKMRALEGGAAASRSTGAGRGAGDGEMTLEKLAEMDADSPEFQKHWKRLVRQGQPE